MKKKIKIIIVIIILLAIAGGITAYFLLRDNDDDDSGELVYVESVENIMGYGISVNSRYVGIVEAQETKKVNPDSDKKVKQLYVSVGDEVKKGDVLFEYDTEEMQLKLRQLQLELQNINNGITTTNQQIADLVKERDEAPADRKIEYTAQIQNLQAEVNQSNYNASSKQLEIDRQQAAMENNKVTAPMDGIVKEINESVAENNSALGGSEYGYGYGYDSGSSDKAYITIMAVGEYRIKGTASELNVRSMSKGDAVIVHSRLDETITWSGTIQSIDLEHTENSNSEEMYYGGGSSETTSNYPFYITLDNTDGLILGEHVYIEPDYGQGEVKEGVWLGEFYIVQDEGGSYVWVENSKGKIEKRKVTLGAYDELMMAYEITSGLSNEDYIAFPEARIKEGMKTTHNFEDVMYEDYGDEYYDDSMYNDEIMYDDEGNMMFYDENGNLIKFDQNGNMFDENGNPITYDEQGNIVYLDEATGTDGIMMDDMDESYDMDELDNVEDSDIDEVTEDSGFSGEEAE